MWIFDENKNYINLSSTKKKSAKYLSKHSKISYRLPVTSMIEIPSDISPDPTANFETQNSGVSRLKN
jgi:hypothetical protein